MEAGSVQILKQNPGNGQSEAVESGSQPFSVYLGEPGRWVRERWMLGCWVSTSGALPVLSCPSLPCRGKTLTRTGARQLRDSLCYGWILSFACKMTWHLPLDSQSECVLVDHSKTFTPAYLIFFSRAVSMLSLSQAAPNSTDLAVRT